MAPGTTMIDLRSDTVTRPTPAMRQAMFEANVGDDGYGDDPTVLALEAKAAAMLAKEAAVFVPTGTMGNLCAVLAQTNRGEEVIVDAAAHIYRTEQGGIASLGGVPYRVLPSVRGAIPMEVLRTELAGSGYGARSQPALLCLETTHNAAGGRVIPLDYLDAARALTAEHGMGIHIDGARMFNAAVALGVRAAEIATYADTVTFCLSKGLGAPVGSLLCGSKAVIGRARKVRKLLGGTMRQAGVIAAAGIVGLDTMVDRLCDDHRKAKRLAEGLAALHPGISDPAAVETNILFAEMATSGLSAADWCRSLAEHGVTCRPYTATAMRLVTHQDISDDAIEQALASFHSIWSSSARRAP